MTKEQINEWTQVYLGGMTWDENSPGTDNLRDITIMLCNGKLTGNQIVSIMRGMGIPAERVTFALQTYVTPEYLKEVEKNKNTNMSKIYDFSTAMDKINYLKAEITNLISVDENKINYTAKSALAIVDKYTTISNEISQISEKITKIDEDLVTLVDGREETFFNKDLFSKEISQLEERKNTLVRESFYKKEQFDITSQEAKDNLQKLSTLLKNEEAITELAAANDNIKDFASKIEESIKNEVSFIETEITKFKENILESEKLTDLKKNKELLENSIQELTKGKRFLYPLSLVAELKSADWLVPVNAFITEMNQVLLENKYSYFVNNAYYQLKNAKYVASQELVDVLESELETNESELRSKLIKTFEAYKWVPQINAIILEFANDEKILMSTGNGILNTLFSPIKENADNSITFTLFGKYYSLKGSEISEATKENLPDSKYIMIEKALRNFSKMTSEKLEMFSQKSSLEINLTESVVKINEKSVEYQNVELFKNALVQSGLVQLSEMYKVSEIMSLLENLESLKELDFITSIQSNKHNGVFVNVIKVNESIYLNRINSSMGVNELVKTETAIEAQTLVNEFVQFDISNLIFEKLEKEVQENIKLEKEKESLSKQIAFLEEKKNSIKTAISQIGESSKLTEAIELIDNEIKKFDILLQESYTKLSKKKLTESNHLDKGFVPGQVKEGDGDFKKGEKISVKAEDYTKSGDDDLIDIIKGDGSVIKDALKKKFITIL